MNLADLYDLVRDLYENHPHDTPVEGYNGQDGDPGPPDIYFNEEEKDWDGSIIPANITVSVTF